MFCYLHWFWKGFNVFQKRFNCVTCPPPKKKKKHVMSCFFTQQSGGLVLIQRYECTYMYGIYNLIQISNAVKFGNPEPFLVITSSSNSQGWLPRLSKSGIWAEITSSTTLNTWDSGWKYKRRSSSTGGRFTVDARLEHQGHGQLTNATGNFMYFM